MEFLTEQDKQAIDLDYILSQVDVLTPYGQMFKRRMGAYQDLKSLEREFDRQELLMPFLNEGCEEIDHIFSEIKDLRRSIRRAADGFVLTEVELFEIKAFLRYVRELSEAMEKRGMPVLEGLEVRPVEELEELLDPEHTGTGTFYIYDAYSETLKGIRAERNRAEQLFRQVRKTVKESLESAYGIRVAPDGTVSVSREKPELIERLRTDERLAIQSESYMNIRFFLLPNEAMSEAEAKIQAFKKKEEEEEYAVRAVLSKKLGHRRRELFLNIGSIGRLDLLFAKVKFARASGGVRPEWTEERRMELVDGIYPKTARFLERAGLRFTPVSLTLEAGATCITGANMGGKTISLKTVGLLSAMAQFGLFVPARRLKGPLNEYIRTSVGDAQSADTGLSTFGGEIYFVSEALKLADRQGLLLIDELARGTNPEEGYAISRAVVHHLKDRKATALLTTHYDHVANQEGVVHYQVSGLSEVDLLQLKGQKELKDKMKFINEHMDYQLKLANATEGVPRAAIDIAAIMGLDEGIIRSAECYLKESIGKGSDKS